MTQPDRPLYYILGPGHIPVPATLHEWAVWFQTADTRIALDEIAPGLRVSTVFLGVDHNLEEGAAILFETMVFDDYGGDEQHRYSSWDDAEAGHRAVVERLRAALPDRIEGGDA